jgi:mono/diheme cytochrome c family protein
MKRVLAAAVILGTATFGFAQAQSTGDASYEMVERGRYLAVLGDCTACHTAPGGKPYAGGFKIETPFGPMLGPNITPDPDTGIGNMSDGEFQRVMHEGIGPHDTHLYPAMPYPAYTKVTAEDNAAILAYLRTLPAVHNGVEPNQLSFPFNIRASLTAWNWLNFDEGYFTPDPKKSPEWNRGAYIVEALGHCGSCHTPKSITGGDENGRFLEGATLQNWYAPDITADPHRGIGAWSSDEIVQYMKTGANRYDIASGPMAEMVENSSQFWTDADLKAVAVYLKEGRNAGEKPPAPISDKDKRMVAGREIYDDRCAACHVRSGEGIARLFPKLSDAALVNNADATSLIRVVLAGSGAGATPAAPTGPTMPAFAWNMSDADVANVLTYIRNAWGNAAPAVVPGDVAKLRSALQE